MLRHSCAHALQQELPTSAPNGAQGKGNMLFGRFSFYRFRFRVAWERSSTDSKVQNAPLGWTFRYGQGQFRSNTASPNCFVHDFAPFSAKLLLWVRLRSISIRIKEDGIIRARFPAKLLRNAVSCRSIASRLSLSSRIFLCAMVL